MITARTKRQLVIFVILTLVGVTYVGARYARLDRLFYDSTYEVNADFGDDSGGIFQGSEVTYRGVRVGQVSGMKLTRDGVDVVLSIDKDNDRIPADTLAVVANRSAVGEQYLDLQPRTAKGPYLKQGSTIEPRDTRVPVPTATFLGNTASMVESVDTNQLRTVVSEFGSAFHGTGPDLARIIDTSNAFIKEADRNFEVTSALIKDSSTVLRTQAQKGSAIRNFSRDLELFTNTLAGHDKQLRTLIENGAATTAELRAFLQANKVDLGSLIRNLVTTNEVTVKRLKGQRTLLVLYPWIVAASYSLTVKGPDGYDAQFGLILQQESPACTKGYPASVRRDPVTDRGNAPLPKNITCDPSPSGPNWRGERFAPRAPVGTYDVSSSRFSWADSADATKGTVAYDGGARAVAGKDSWKWLLLQPAVGTQD